MTAVGAMGSASPGGGSPPSLDVSLRYALPGTLVVFVALLISYIKIGTSEPTALAGLGIALALLVTPIGYLLYQVWILIWDSGGVGWVGYCREGRPNIKVVALAVQGDLAKPPTSSDALARVRYILKDHRPKCQWNRLLLLAYFSEEKWVNLAGVIPGHFNRASRLWSFFHTSMASCVACFLSACAWGVCLWRGYVSWEIGDVWLIPLNWLPFLAFVVGIFVFGISAARVLREVNAWELVILHHDTAAAIGPKTGYDWVIADIPKVASSGVIDVVMSHGCCKASGKLPS